MSKKNNILVGFILVFLVMNISGCLDFSDFYNGGVTYETHPTKVQYTLRYGYTISCSGLGEHEINYDCDIPELLKGTVSYELLHTTDYVRTQLANNSIISWNITGKNNKNYELGIVANVTARGKRIRAV